MREAKRNYTVSELDIVQINLTMQLISDRFDALEGLRGEPRFYSDVNVGNNKITSVADPENEGDAVNYKNTAPRAAHYLVTSYNDRLTGERKLTAGDGITTTDNGANSTFIVAVDYKKSLEIDSGKLQLVNDVLSPGNSYYYGTSAAGVKGWHTLVAVPHNLLSATHTDTLAGTVTAGDIIYANSTPKWARLAKGTDGQVLTLAAGYPSWAATSATVYRRSATKVVAASNALDTTNADYICDGTNDEVQIQAAIDAVNTGGVGGRVLLSEGDFNIEAKITLYSDIWLQGSGVGALSVTGGTTLHLCYDGIMLEASSKNNIKISDMQIVGHMAAAAEFPTYDAQGYGNNIVNLLDCYSVMIDSVFFGLCAPAVYARQAWEFWFLNCTFQVCGGDGSSVVELYNGATDKCAGVKFIGCVWQLMYGYGVYSNCSGAGSVNDHISWTDNKFEAFVTGDSTAIYGKMFICQMTGNGFWDNDTTNPNVNITTGSGSITMTGNTFGGGSYNITMNASDCLIASNTFYSCNETYHINVAGGNDNYITGNYSVADKVLCTNSGTRTVMTYNWGAQQGQLWLDDDEYRITVDTIISNAKKLKGRNAANSADLDLIWLDSSNYVNIGNSTSDRNNIIGNVYLQNNKAIYSRNAADNADKLLLYMASDNTVNIATSPLADVNLAYELPTGKVLYLAPGAVDANPVYIHVGGASHQITEGADDTGGAGYKVLRVPN